MEVSRPMEEEEGHLGELNYKFKNTIKFKYLGLASDNKEDTEIQNRLTEVIISY